MRKISNPTMVKRNQTIGKAINMAAFGFALISVVLSFMDPTTNTILLYVLLLMAFILFLLGNYFTNRYGRSPTPDDAIDGLLKGLDNNYTAIHYRLGYDHALFTPNGILAVVPKYEHGGISFVNKNSWKQTGVSFIRKFFTSEAVGDPITEGRDAADQLARSLQKILQTETAPEVRPVVVFVHEQTQVEAADSPIPVLPAAKFKEYVRKVEKRIALTPDQMRKVLEFCGE